MARIVFQFLPKYCNSYTNFFKLYRINTNLFKNKNNLEHKYFKKYLNSHYLNIFYKVTLNNYILQQFDHL